MNRIEIAVMKPSTALNTFVDTWRRVEGGGQVTPSLVFGSLRELFSAITEKRLELLRYVAAHEALNIHQLSQGLSRHYKNVHTDVKDLVELGLLQRDDQGKLAAPFDEIVIYAGIRDAA